MNVLNADDSPGGMNSLIASGITIPVSVWLFSKIAHTTRVLAHIVAFNMCTYSACKQKLKMLLFQLSLHVKATQKKRSIIKRQVVIIYWFLLQGLSENHVSRKMRNVINKWISYTDNCCSTSLFHSLAWRVLSC